jgi:D-3-phosphoglycerate dehydrogenase
MTIKVFQVDKSPRLAPYTFEEEAIRAAGGELIVADCQTEDDVIEQAQDAEILLLSWRRILTPRVMEALPNARLFVRWGVGYDMIDAEAAAERGIAVSNTPTYCTQDVAEHAMALLFAIARRIVWAHERIRSGEYVAPDGPIFRLTGRTLGIIGCGRIGSAVAKRALGVGMRVIAYDKYRPASELEAIGVIPMSFEQVLEEADYLTLHTLLNKETRHLIDAAALARMKRDAMIVNTSRGPVIDQDALIEALKSGKLAGAGLDVFESEPLPVDSELRKLEHVVLTPHAAAFTQDSIQALREEMCTIVARWIDESWGPTIVNPEVKPILRPRLVPAAS